MHKGQRVVIYRDPHIQRIEEGSGLLIEKKATNRFCEIWEVEMESGERVHRRILKEEFDLSY